ncbi:MAG: hypothetical protein AVDCRST_MAG59-4098 [uncultured Thermomicrobiales bacterium]|uniref:Uncharacterized protein n=1 Tax=uncultured Thermomicrobiales bacterium TaxID=1645740 RepID=A0A6J4VHV4_9BACT|nr:MAG: hypothetical protein AVDCRST_MAG59-4098 [uncultured Thermomicrobiales bacterium]
MHRYGIAVGGTPRFLPQEGIRIRAHLRLPKPFTGISYHTAKQPRL